jgi:dUTP pyrophosphatase
MTTSVPVGVLRLAGGADLPLPAYMTAGAAGADVCAAVDADAPVTLAPGERALIPLGFALEVPAGYEMQIRPRSGLALKSGVTMINSPGTIDSDYRGPVGVILVNLGQIAHTINRGDRIAQMILAPVSRAAFAETAELTTTVRGEGGFGSTGHMHTAAS